MLDKIGEIVSESVTLPFKLTIQGVKWICSGVNDIIEGIAEDPKSSKLDKTKDQSIDDK